MKSSVVLAALMLVVLSGTVRAELVYRYVYEDGQTRTVKDLDAVPQKPVPKAEKVPPAGPAPAAKRRAPVIPPQQEVQKQAAGRKVEVYLTSWCGHCREVTRFLDEKKIPYTVYDIEKDKAAAKTFRGFGGIGVPVVRVGTHVIIGYNPEEILARLNDK
jgi:glutaredoxin